MPRGATPGLCRHRAHDRRATSRAACRRVGGCDCPARACVETVRAAATRSRRRRTSRPRARCCRTGVVRSSTCHRRMRPPTRRRSRMRCRCRTLAPTCLHARRARRTDRRCDCPSSDAHAWHRTRAVRRPRLRSASRTRATSRACDALDDSARGCGLYSATLRASRRRRCATSARRSASSHRMRRALGARCPSR